MGGDEQGLPGVLSYDVRHRGNNSQLACHARFPVREGELKIFPSLRYGAPKVRQPTVRQLALPQVMADPNGQALPICKGAHGVDGSRKWTRIDCVDAELGELGHNVERLLTPPAR